MPRRYFLHLLSAAGPAGDHVPDTDLLARFAQGRDPAAFELVARRHADAVWAACRRVARTEADAEDAFQATFLVLARKAGAVRGPCVGGWLHRVAVHAALKVRTRAARGGIASPDQLAALPAEAVPEPDADAGAAVQEEVARLPDRYRLPVVLCELEGQTHAAAAKALGWPVGSVSGRLSRARAILRDRLARRGVAPVAGVVAVLPAGGLPARAVPAVIAAAAGTVPVPLPVSSLAEGVLSAMRAAKLKLIAAAVVSVGLLGLVGTGTVLAWPRSGPPAVAVPKPGLPLDAAAPVPPDTPIEGAWLPKKPGDVIPTAFPGLVCPEPVTALDLARICPHLFGETAVAIEPTDDTRRQLLKARLYQAAEEAFRLHMRAEIGSPLPTENAQYISCLEDMRGVVVELWANDPKNLLPRLEELVVLAKDWERTVSSRVQAGADPPRALYKAQGHRLASEAALWKAKNKKPGPR